MSHSSTLKDMYGRHFWLGLNVYTTSSDCSGSGCSGKMTWLDGTTLDCSTLGNCGSIFDTIDRNDASYFNKDSHTVKGHTGNKDVVCEAMCTVIPTTTTTTTTPPPRESCTLKAPFRPLTLLEQPVTSLGPGSIRRTLMRSTPSCSSGSVRAKSTTRQR